MLASPTRPTRHSLQHQVTFFFPSSPFVAVACKIQSAYNDKFNQHGRLAGWMTMWALGWTHFSPALMVRPSPTQHKKKRRFVGSSVAPTRPDQVWPRWLRRVQPT
jgi:hypothetical protein